MTLAEILNDSKTFADGMEITLGTEKVTLGDLRSLTAKQQRDLSDKLAAAENKQKEAVETATRAATLLASLEEAKTKLSAEKSNTGGGGDDDFDSSEWWKPVRDRLQAKDKKIDEAIAKIDALAGKVTQAATIWAKDRWRNEFDREAPRLKKVKDYADWDYDKVLGYATQHKIVDEDGMPSVSKTIRELTKANEIEEIKKQAYEDGLKAGRTKARLETMPKPTSATGGRLPKDKSAVEEMGLEGLGDDVANDPELMDQIGALLDVDPMSLKQ